MTVTHGKGAYRRASCGICDNMASAEHMGTKTKTIDPTTMATVTAIVFSSRMLCQTRMKIVIPSVEKIPSTLFLTNIEMP